MESSISETGGEVTPNQSALFNSGATPTTVPARPFNLNEVVKILFCL
jgi:hypothetical protein